LETDSTETSANFCLPTLTHFAATLKHKDTAKIWIDLFDISNFKEDYTLQTTRNHRICWPSWKKVCFRNAVKASVHYQTRQLTMRYRARYIIL